MQHRVDRAKVKPLASERRGSVSLDRWREEACQQLMDRKREWDAYFDSSHLWALEKLREVRSAIRDLWHCIDTVLPMEEEGSGECEAVHLMAESLHAHTLHCLDRLQIQKLKLVDFEALATGRDHEAQESFEALFPLLKRGFRSWRDGGFKWVFTAEEINFAVEQGDSWRMEVAASETVLKSSLNYLTSQVEGALVAAQQLRQIWDIFQEHRIIAQQVQMMLHGYKGSPQEGRVLREKEEVSKRLKELRRHIHSLEQGGAGWDRLVALITQIPLSERSDREKEECTHLKQTRKNLEDAEQLLEGWITSLCEAYGWLGDASPSSWRGLEERFLNRCRVFLRPGRMRGQLVDIAFQLEALGEYRRPELSDVLITDKIQDLRELGVAERELIHTVVEELEADLNLDMRSSPELVHRVMTLKSHVA